MSAFFDSLRSDLLDRRMRPLLALVGLVLVAAIVYAVLAGSGSTSPQAPGPAPSTGSAAGVTVTAVKPEDTQAIAETTSGAVHQTAGGATRNPFKPLPQPKASVSSQNAASPASSLSTGSSSSTGAASGQGSESSSGSGSGSETKPSGTTPSKPKSQKRRTVYRVSVLFGAAAPGTPFEAAELTPYEDLARQQPLPSAQQALVVFRGVIAGGGSTTFTLVGEAILRGAAVCRPSASQCQTIDLKAGQTEELEYAPPGATPTNYLLHVVAIKSEKATAAAARRLDAHESKAGIALLRSAGLDALPGLRYSGAKGVLVFAGAGAHDARARIATVGVLGSAPQGLSASK